MPLLISHTVLPPSHHDRLGSSTTTSYTLASFRGTFLVSTSHGVPCSVSGMRHGISSSKHLAVSRHRAVTGNSEPDTHNSLTFDWGAQEPDGTEDLDSPWEGAVIYRRNSSVSHVEYCTTLESLGLEKLSSETSKLRASTMGLRVTNSVKDYPLGTPVQISIDVSRNRKNLRLDGIIRTVITLGCSRCGEPAAESVYSNFSLLLRNEPIEEPEILNMGTIYGEERSKSSLLDKEQVIAADEADIDMDDWIYFPPEEKEIDISKHLRDLVHLEITLNAVCDPGCKGMCLKCGTNLNANRCSCSELVDGKKQFGPLGNLKKQMQQQ